MKKILKPNKNTWSFFGALLAVDIGVTLGGMFLNFNFANEFFWYQILWGAIIAEKVGINTASGAYNPSTAGWIVLGLTLLVNLFIIYLLALFLSKKVFKGAFEKRANKKYPPRFEPPVR